MALTPRQALVYNHLAELYSPSKGEPYASDNKPGVERWTLVEGGPFPCRFELKQSTDLASLVGRLEGDQIETTDLVHFSEDSSVDDNYFLKNVSLNPDGTQSTLYGRWWTVRGQPTKFINSARRRGGKVTVRASQEKNAPLGIED